MTYDARPQRCCFIFPTLIAHVQYCCGPRIAVSPVLRSFSALVRCTSEDLAGYAPQQSRSVSVDVNSLSVPSGNSSDAFSFLRFWGKCGIPALFRTLETRWMDALKEYLTKTSRKISLFCASFKASKRDVCLLSLNTATALVLVQPWVVPLGFGGHFSNSLCPAHNLPAVSADASACSRQHVSDHCLPWIVAQRPSRLLTSFL